MEGRLFLKCFPRSFFREKSSSSSSSSSSFSSSPSIDEDEDEVGGGLFSSLAMDIQQLQTLLLADQEKYSSRLFSLQWCVQATDLLRKLHSLSLGFVHQKGKEPLASSICFLTDEYMRQTLCLLDLCNWLKQAICSINRYCLVIDFAAKRLPDLDEKSIAEEIEKIGRETEKLQKSIEKPEDVPSFFKLSKFTKRKIGVDRGFLYGNYMIQSSMKIICSLLFSAVIYPVSLRVDNELLPSTSIKFPPLKLLYVLLRRLVGYNGENCSPSGGCALVEVIMAERAVLGVKEEVLKDMLANKENFVKSVDLMKRRCGVLREGLDRFEDVLTELFGEAVKGRNKILGREN